MDLYMYKLTINIYTEKINYLPFSELYDIIPQTIYWVCLSHCVAMLQFIFTASLIICIIRMLLIFTSTNNDYVFEFIH